MSSKYLAKFHYILALFATAALAGQLAGVGSNARADEDACVTSDKACALRSESWDATCARIMKAKAGGKNPGYEFAYCNNTSSYNFGWTSPENRVKKPPEKPSPFAHVESIGDAPRLDGGDAHAGDPIAKTGQGIITLGILGADKLIDSTVIGLNKNGYLSADALAKFMETKDRCTHNFWLNIPRDAKPGSIALETVNNAISSAGLMGIQKGQHSSEVISNMRVEARVLESGPSLNASGQTVDNSAYNAKITKAENAELVKAVIKANEKAGPGAEVIAKGWDKDGKPIVEIVEPKTETVRKAEELRALREEAIAATMKAEGKPGKPEAKSIKIADVLEAYNRLQSKGLFDTPAGKEAKAALENVLRSEGKYRFPTIAESFWKENPTEWMKILSEPIKETSGPIQPVQAKAIKKAYKDLVKKFKGEENDVIAVVKILRDKGVKDNMIRRFLKSVCCNGSCKV